MTLILRGLRHSKTQYLELQQALTAGNESHPIYTLAWKNQSKSFFNPTDTCFSTVH